MRVTAGHNRDHSNGKQGVCNKGHVGPEGIWQNARVSVEPEEYFLIRALRSYACCQNKQQHGEADEQRICLHSVASLTGWSPLWRMIMIGPD